MKLMNVPAKGMVSEIWLPRMMRLNISRPMESEPKSITFAPFSAPKSGRGLAGGVFAGYGGAPLLFFETADNILLLLFSMLGAVLFLGGTRPVFCGGESPLWLIGKTVALLELFLVADAVLPDLRTDRTVDLNFKFFLPFALFWLAATAAVLTAAEGAL